MQIFFVITSNFDQRKPARKANSEIKAKAMKRKISISDKMYIPLSAKQTVRQTDGRSDRQAGPCILTSEIQMTRS